MTTIFDVTIMKLAASPTIERAGLRSLVKGLKEHSYGVMRRIRRAHAMFDIPEDAPCDDGNCHGHKCETCGKEWAHVVTGANDDEYDAAHRCPRCGDLQLRRRSWDDVF